MLPEPVLVILKPGIRTAARGGVKRRLTELSAEILLDFRTGFVARLESDCLSQIRRWPSVRAAGGVTIKKRAIPRIRVPVDG